MTDSRYSRRHGFLAAIFDRVLIFFFRWTNRFIAWHRLPRWLGVANLIALRVELRQHNLYDTDGDLTHPKESCPFHPGPGASTLRTPNGTLNDLQHPAMGCRYSRFGRNMSTKRPVTAEPALLRPNPLVVSQRLLARKEFKPATSLNLLAAAWIQLQVHDWFGHENESLAEENKIRVPQSGDWHQPALEIAPTKLDPTNSKPLSSRYPAYRNKNPQWWDGSQIYGETDLETCMLRTDPSTNMLCPKGKLYVDSNGLLPVDSLTGRTISGFTDNWWLGLELLHTLFVKEHNAICQQLAESEPQLTDQELFEVARLVNTAILAKIHTVEWTPGILGHPAIKIALEANWMGIVGHLLGEDSARSVAPWLPDGVVKDILTGVPMSQPDHHGAPYCLTEEFNAVYRLHPLIPDTVRIQRFKERGLVGTYDMVDIAFEKARRPMLDGAMMEDLLYSFGTLHPGAITIKNYPSFLRKLKLPPDPETGLVQELDLAAVDLIRDRERGVPRYNEFRRQLRMPPANSWLELAGGDAALAAELETIYEGELENVDTMVGMFCEPLPKGFGFSDTAFRIFILMASRRLKSDRFFTSDYRPEFYTTTGLKWIARTGLKEMILRHYPQLAPAFVGVSNPFAPWKS